MPAYATMIFSRREFLRWSGYATCGLYLSSDLRWALPQHAPQRRGSSKRITVLGAGMAGLAAGWELRQAGHEVTILEAQLHPGGRVHTVREGLSDDLYSDVGAVRIPITHTITLEWVKHFGLALDPVFPNDGAEVALLKGKRVEMPVSKPVDMSKVPLDLTPDERKIGLANLAEHYCGDTMRRIGGAIREDWPPEIARLADVSMAEFLRQRGASEDAIRYIVLGFEDEAALDYMRDDFGHRSEPLSKIKGGNDQLPRAFAAKLSEVIRYGCAVEHIERNQKRVRVSYRRAGMLDSIEADAIICTIPFGVLRRIPVTPDWSPEKRKVIDSLVYGSVVRATLQVSRRFWEDEGLNGFGSSDKNFEVWQPTYKQPGRRGLLQTYAHEDYAHGLDQLNEQDRVQRVISDVEEVYPRLRQYLETVVVKSWANDPLQRGAFVVYHPGQQKWYSDVCKREGRVWFAGEHASPLPGWIQGAVTSGIKAAQEINAGPHHPER